MPLITRKYLEAPEMYDGTIGDFFDRYCRPNLVSTDRMIRIHDDLLIYADRMDAVFFIRQVSGLERRRMNGSFGPIVTAASTTIAGTDNSPAWSIHSAAVSGTLPSGEEFAKWLLEKLPCHIHDVRREVKYSLNDANWHAAHIFGAKDGDTGFESWDRLELRRRFLRNVHPLNIALCPKPNWQRIGGDPGFLGFMVSRYREIYGKTWDGLEKAIGEFWTGEAWESEHKFSYQTNGKATAIRSVAPQVVTTSMTTFVVGSKYSTDEIVRQLGGQMQSYLPVNGRVGRIVCGRFNTTINPRAPELVYCGLGQNILAGADRLVNETRTGSGIPVFTRPGHGEWTYRGCYRAVRVVRDPMRIVSARKEIGSDDVGAILELERVGD
jgi:hypothetical protein